MSCLLVGTNQPKLVQSLLLLACLAGTVGSVFGGLEESSLEQPAPEPAKVDSAASEASTYLQGQPARLDAASCPSHNVICPVTRWPPDPAPRCIYADESSEILPRPERQQLLEGGLELASPAERTCTDSSSLGKPSTASDLPQADVPVKQKPPVSEEQTSEEDDRHNFAQARDGAKLVAANREAKKAAAVLDSDGDTFCKNECKVDKWIIIELSQVAKVDTVELSQFELYSSRVKEFEVRGRQNHPRHEGTDYAKTLNSTQWKLLGRFEAANTKGSQAFRVSSPAWVKYLQLHFLSHHGVEAVCTLNDIRIFGRSAADDLEDQLAMDPSFDSTTRAPQQPEASVPQQPPALPTEGASNSAQLAEDNSSTGSAAEADPIMQPSAANTVNATPVVVPEPVQGQTPTPADNPAADPASPPAPEAAAAPASTPASATPTAPVTGSFPGPPTAAPQRNDPPQPGADPSHPAPEPRQPLGPSPPLTIPHPPTSETPDLDAPEDPLLLLPGQGSKAGKPTSVYDILVAELRALKVQQKALPRAFAELERNVSAAVQALGNALGALALEVTALQRYGDAPALPARFADGEHATKGEISMDGVFAALQTAQRQILVREAALLAVLAMLGGALLVNRSLQQADRQHSSETGSHSKFIRMIMALAAANGLCALLLQLRNGWMLWS